MFNKISLALAVVLAISALGSALKCHECQYTSEQPKAEQKCGDKTVDCDTGYCFSGTLTLPDGVTAVKRECANKDPGAKDCPLNPEACELAKKLGFKDCAAFCCTTDLCNNYTPSSSAIGVVAAKFTLLCVVAIAGFLSA